MFGRCGDGMVAMLLTVVIVQLLSICNGMTLRDDHSSIQCGYQSCNPVKEGMLNVHIIPETHDDVGWVKTVKEYYDQEVSKILPSVVERLEQDADVGGSKKFIYVEMAFLKRWWMDIDEAQKDIVRDLVNSGRLEITLGGWCMVDEATTYYTDIIDQHTLGFEFIRQNFGECGRPRLGWQIDPFGHSRELASLFSQFGFDGTFVGRVDYQDKLHRQTTKTMEFIWHTSDSLDENSRIFTGVLANVYWPPKGFCWDQFCHDKQIIYSTENEKQEMVEEFVSIMENWASNFDTNHVMVEMGSDFNYIDADKWFDNLDELIKLTNQKQTDGTNSQVNLLYSTPSCYLYQLNQANRTWTTKSDDFFPYAHRPHSFWTGYFTSRPNFKFLVRKAGAILQACKQIAAFSLLENAELDIAYLKEAMAVVQHHDAVSGTEKQYVTEDYTRLLMDGISYCEQVVQKAYSKLLPITPDIQLPDLTFCLDLDIAECKTTQQSDQFTVILYNPLAQSYSYYVRLPVQDQEYKVFDKVGDEIEHQTLPISRQTVKIPRRFSRMTGVELVFKLELPPMGYATAIVNNYEPTFATFDTELLEEEFIELIEEGIGPEPFVPTEEIIENQYYSVSVDRQSGRISRVWNKEEDVAVSLDQTFLYYAGYPGYNWNAEDQASGAYIFRPTKQTPTRVTTQTVRIVSFKGSQVQEIRQEFSEWVSQVIRIYNDKPYIELEWTVGPIPLTQGGDGREVITRYATDMVTEGEFYTDLNGRETLKRKRNYRDTWDFNNTEHVSGNYFPITSRASIKDEDRNIQLTVLVDRSEGCSSITDGSLEIMVHRRTTHDDSLGVNEPLREPGPGRHGIVARGRHLLLLNKIPNAAAAYRQTYRQLNTQPLAAFSTEKSYAQEWPLLYQTQWSGMTQSLPSNINILTLERWPSPLVETEHPAFLLRLEHGFGKLEDQQLSGPELVSLKRLFTPFEVLEAIELSLGANMKKEDMHKLKWRYKGEPKFDQDERIQPTEPSLVIELAPMQIRTFQINVQVLP